MHMHWRDDSWISSSKIAKTKQKRAYSLNSRGYEKTFVQEEMGE